MAAILIVDDSPVVQRILSFVLGRAGHITTTVGDGLEALSVLDATPFDLAVVDVNMPNMDGIALLSHIRADGRYRSLPVIMLSATGQDVLYEAAWAAGASEFLFKPISSHEILDAIGRFLPAGNHADE